MSDSALLTSPNRLPAPRAVLELTKPVTWFPPIWAFMCGTVSSGQPLGANLGFVMCGMLLTGPLVCGTSQVMNDWCDRHVDAINQPDRPIPSGRIPGRWGIYIALIGSAISMLVAFALGLWVLAATVVALIAGWAYSAPPLRFKQSGWLGPAVVALSYEGLSWFTGAAVLTGGLPSTMILAVLLLYSVGAHGIMTLNDFKAVRGDIATGVRSLPVVMGERGALLYACAIMAAAQVAVIVLLAFTGYAISAAIVGLVLFLQFACMARLARDPERLTPWYNATGVSLYVLGMLAAALGLGGYW